MATMPRILSVSVILLALALGSGCSTPDSTSSAPSGHDLRTGIRQLNKGMTQAAVRNLLGEPDSTTTKQTDIGTVDAWIYRSTYTTGSKQVQTGTTTYTRENPFTNVPETITEPVFGTQNIYEKDELTLVFQANQLLEWAVTRDHSQQVN